MDREFMEELKRQEYLYRKQSETNSVRDDAEDRLVTIGEVRALIRKEIEKERQRIYNEFSRLLQK